MCILAFPSSELFGARLMLVVIELHLHHRDARDMRWSGVLNKPLFCMSVKENYRISSRNIYSNGIDGFH